MEPIDRDASGCLPEPRHGSTSWLAGRAYVDEGVPHTTRSAVVVLASGMVVSERSGQLPLPLLADGPDD